MDSSIIKFNSPDSAMIVDTVLYIFLALIAGMMLALIIKLLTYRVLVEKCYILKSGNIIKTGRYREYWDKKLKLKYLMPMNGKDRLPGFPTKAFQKVWGVPFFGVNRHLILQFNNKYSPTAIVPKQVTGEAVKFNTLKYYIEDMKEEFIRKLKKQGYMAKLHDYAPVIVIIGAIGFWAYAIFAQVNIYETIADKINDVGSSLIKLFEGGRSG